MADTKHAVREVVEYSVEDHASAGLHGVAHAAEKAGVGIEHAKERLGELRSESKMAMAAMFGVGFGLGAWVEKAKEANAEFNQTKRGLAALYSTSLAWDKSTSATERYTRSLKLANENTEDLENIGMRFGTNLSEVGRIYKTLGISAAPLKITQGQLLALTQQTAAAAKLYGVDGADAASKVGIALMGGPIRKTDDFGKALANALKDIKRGGSGHKALEEFSHAMGGFVGQADEASKTMGDSFTRIHMVVDKLFRQLTGPLFTEVAQQISDVAKQLQAVGESGKPMIQEYAVKLVDAFHEIQKVTKFIFDHWKQIAAIWAGAKITGLGMDLARSAAGGGLGASIKGLGIPIVGALVGKAVSDVEGLREQYADIRKQGEGFVPLIHAAQDYNSSGAFGGPKDTQGTVAQLQAQFKNLGISSYEEYKARVGGLYAGAQMTGDVAKQLGGKESIDRLTTVLQTFVDQNKALIFATKAEAADENADKSRKFTGKPDVNIAHLEVKMNFEDMDPERVFVKFTDDLHKLASTRTMSAVSHPDLGNG